MRQTIKIFLWVVGLVFSLQSVRAYSLLGPSAAYPGVPSTFGDAWEQNTIGFNPIDSYNGGAPPYLGFDTLAIGPKNIGEGYRRNTPVIYYSFDQNFAGFFGVNGEQAVDGAIAILNSAFTNNPATGQYLTNGVDSFSPDLLEYPLQSQSENYSAAVVGLLDLKSVTLAVMMEQLGLADSIRYIWILHNRFQNPGTTAPCPAGYVYLVTLRNFDIIASSLSELQYSEYVNNGLYSYSIPDDCGAAGSDSPPDADAVEIPADPLVNNPPVASGGQMAAGSLADGFFYNGLTRDDMAGLRLLYSSTNVNTETAAPNSTALTGGGLTITNLSDEYELTTSNLTALILASRTNNPAALQALYPGLVISSVISNFNGTFTYTFGNVVYYTLYTNTSVKYQVQTIRIGPLIGAPAGSPAVTNISTKSTTIVTNLSSGDFFLIPTNLCGLEVLSLVTNIPSAITNSLGTSTTTNSTTITTISTNVVVVSTNHTLLVAPCEFIGGSGATNSTTGKYAGIEKILFVRVPDQNIDPLTGNFVQPITNTYTLTVVPPNSSQATVQTFQRVLARPDILFTAQDLVPGPAAINTANEEYSRSINFNMNNILPNLAGPGTIDPSSTVIFNKAGPILENEYPETTLANAGLDAYIWGSFDGSTNVPVIYPNGTSIATLESEALIQISPVTLPDATSGTPYSVTLSVTGGQPPYTWMLATNSPALPTALSLSAGGVISGTPNESGTFDFTVQMNDSSARSVQMPYSLTIH
ncbi:MAG: Ig domain-containing protein [Limisphaerales bacterium]